MVLDLRYSTPHGIKHSHCIGDSIILSIWDCVKFEVEFVIQAMSSGIEQKVLRRSGRGPSTPVTTILPTKEHEAFQVRGS